MKNNNFQMRNTDLCCRYIYIYIPRTTLYRTCTVRFLAVADRCNLSNLAFCNRQIYQKLTSSMQ